MAKKEKPGARQRQRVGVLEGIASVAKRLCSGSRKHTGNQEHGNVSGWCSWKAEQQAASVGCVVLEVGPTGGRRGRVGRVEEKESSLC